MPKQEGGILSELSIPDEVKLNMLLDQYKDMYESVGLPTDPLTNMRNAMQEKAGSMPSARRRGRTTLSDVFGALGNPLKGSDLLPAYLMGQLPMFKNQMIVTDSERNQGIPFAKQEGGMLPDEQMIQEDIMAESVPPEGMPNDKDIINSAVQAIKGESQNPEIALGAFLQMFGEEALRDLVERVQSGEFDMNANITEGLLTGVGDGMDDMIPATLEGEQDVVLSDGEFIVPADVVSGIGNGSTESGSRRLYDMMDRVRMMRGGSLKQPPDVPVDDMLHLHDFYCCSKRRS